MDVQDLRNLETSASIDTDLCIIGSGPAGLTIAGEFIGSKRRTLIVESGAFEEDLKVNRLNEVESIGATRVADQTLVRNRQFGGTSHSWTGRCAPFDEVDFAQRPWVPFSGWPISRASLDPFLQRAAGYLGLLPHAPASIEPSIVDNALLHECIWQYSIDATSPLDYMRFGPAYLAKKPADARILLHATVTQLRTNDAGSAITGVEVTSPNGNRALIRARTIVLCAGGIENARMLLYSNRQIAAGVGNRHDMVGRFLMDHPRCTLGQFHRDNSEAVRDRYGLFRQSGRNFFVRGLGLSTQAQERLQLLNCAAWLTEHRAADDPWEAAKRIVSRRRPSARDAWRVVSQPRLVTRGLADRIVRGRGLPHKLERLVLDCIVEQRPDPDSRLTLSDRTDYLNLPLARLDWRISTLEQRTAAHLGDLIVRELSRMGLPPPELSENPNFTDASHPTGTTRMAMDPRHGVVTPDCRVHGMMNLFVAGSSIFPTSGHANPTLMIVALAIRLADHLRET